MLKRAKYAAPAVIVALLAVCTTAVAHAMPVAATTCDAAKLDSPRPSHLALDLATAHAAPIAILAPADSRLHLLHPSSTLPMSSPVEPLSPRGPPVHSCAL